MKVTKNLNIKMKGNLNNDKPNPRNRWNRDDACAGRKGCDPVVKPDFGWQKKDDKKVTPIVKEQPKTLSF